MSKVVGTSFNDDDLTFVKGRLVKLIKALAPDIVVSESDSGISLVMTLGPLIEPRPHAAGIDVSTVQRIGALLDKFIQNFEPGSPEASALWGFKANLDSL